MTVLPVSLLALAAAAATLLGRRWPRAAWGIGLIGLVATATVATGIHGGDGVPIGGAVFLGSPYLRLMAVLAATCGLLMTVIGLATGAPRSTAGAILLWLSTATLAVAAGDVVVGIAFAIVASLAAVSDVPTSPGPTHILVAARSVRAVILSGIVGLVAVAWLCSAVGAASIEGIVDGATGPALVGFAYLAVAGAFAARGGAIPFHVWTTRFIAASPTSGIPIALVWGPAALALVVLGWAGPSLGPVAGALGSERSIVLLVGAASVILAGIAAYLHDDVEHVVGYTLIQDVGVVLLALGTLDPSAAPSARTWILASAVVKTGFVAWAVAVRHAFGAHRLPELGGWARRSPILGAALVLVAIGAIGLPGLAAFEARADLIHRALDGPFDAVVLLGALLVAGSFVRILLIGFRTPSAKVAMGADPLPRWPAGASAAVDRRLVASLPAAWRLNRAPIAAVGVLALSLIGVGVAAGGLDLRSAALAATPTSTPRPTARPTPSPTEGPLETAPPEETPPGETGPDGTEPADSFGPVQTP